MSWLSLASSSLTVLLVISYALLLRELIVLKGRSTKSSSVSAQLGKTSQWLTRLFDRSQKESTITGRSYQNTPSNYHEFEKRLQRRRANGVISNFVLLALVLLGVAAFAAGTTLARVHDQEESVHGR